MIYGYARVSTVKQKITRQISNILKDYPEAKIFQEAWTGTTTDRTEWKKLKKIVKSGDLIIFDSVSRMSRNSSEGIKEYFELFDKNISLIFLKEKYINTSVYKEQLKINKNIQVGDKDLDDTIMQGIRGYLKRLAEKQIEIAFEQAEKEVLDLRQRTKEGLQVKKAEGKILGRRIGSKIETKKSKEMKVKIRMLSKNFDGNLKDIDVMNLLKLRRNTYYKYKKEMKNLIN